MAQVLEAYLDSRSMIDLRAARNDPDAFRAALARKGAAEVFDELLEADRAWREIQPRVEELRAARKIKGKPTPEQLEELERLKEELQGLEQQLAAAEAAARSCSTRVPESRPTTRRPTASPKTMPWRSAAVGEPPSFDFAVRDHLELAAGGIDLERARARSRGARFAYRSGDVALLELALYRFALDRLGSRGFIPVLPPVLVREEAMYGTGFFPTDEVNIYAVERDELYLVGTSEVRARGDARRRDPRRGRAAAPLRRLLDVLPARGGRGRQGHARDVPRPPVRQGRDVRRSRDRSGHATSTSACSRSRRSSCRSSSCPIASSTSPRATSARRPTKKYDIEAWFPSQERYREITSTSNTTDYQARRLEIRYRRDEKQLEPVHTLNGTAVTGRAMLAIMENFQEEDGSVSVPEPLRELGAPRKLGAERARA